MGEAVVRHEPGKYSQVTIWDCEDQRIKKGDKKLKHLLSDFNRPGLSCWLSVEFLSEKVTIAVNSCKATLALANVVVLIISSWKSNVNCQSLYLLLLTPRCTRVGSTNGIKSYDYGKGAPRMGQQKRVCLKNINKANAVNISS